MQLTDIGIQLFQIIQTLGKQFKWIAGLLMLIAAARGIRDRDLPELAVEQQPTGMPLMWLRRAVGLALTLGVLVFVGLGYQGLAERMLQIISSLPGQP